MAKPPLTQVQKDQRLRKTAVWGIFVFTMVLTSTLRTRAVLEFPNFDFPMGPPNPDVWVRLTQIRQWLAGGGFFDHTVRGTNAPFGGVTTPWTRPIDIIQSFLYFFTPHSLTPALRLMLSATWMAPMFCIAAVALMARTARRHFNQIHVVVAAVFLTIFNSYLADYFSPGDADHHGFMSMLWCGVLCLITLDPLSDRAALGAGALLGAITWVSPEGLMLIAPVYALLGLEALFRPRKMTALALITMGAALVVSGALFIEHAPGDRLHPVYDSLSIVQVFLLWLVAAAAGLLAAVYERGASIGVRMAAVGVAGVGVLLIMHTIYPKFFGGPLVDADPFIFAHFLPNVTEAQPLVKTPWPDIIRELSQPVLALGLLAAAFWRNWKRMRPAKRRYLLLLAPLMFYTAMLTLVQVRWEYYLQPVAIILCAALLPGIAMRSKLWMKRRPPRQWRPYLWLAVVFALTAGAAKVTPAPDRTAEVLCMNQVRFILQTQQLPKLIGDENMVVYLPENAGGDALFFSPYGIIASNYHREGTGMRDMYALATAKFVYDAFVVLHKRQVKAMLYCPDNFAVNAWLRVVAEKKHYPKWMTPVEGLKFFEFEKEHPKPVLFKIKT